MKRPTASRRPRAKAKRTFAQAQSEILSTLREQGWTVKSDLKIPHATSPDGKYRLWFKTQAVYFCFAEPGGRHDFGNARSTWIEDIRQLDGPGFLAEVLRHRKHYEQT